MRRRLVGLAIAATALSVSSPALAQQEGRNPNVATETQERYGEDPGKDTLWNLLGLLGLAGLLGLRRRNHPRDSLAR